ncbi:MAG: NADH-quinone oxidoreductase subunit NuoF, partial [Bacteroidales bacterium]|jgi:NADH:ubiquinone oxidoreductase subunit F (NADH-binding)/NADH:ubiquinone oxidoreductase subunit E|nr:NADH-quinone oxidoreductase subunit NuoF [Bacteroidales bacterium]
LVQKASGNNLTKELIAEVAEVVGVTPSRAFGVATYYSMFNVSKGIGKYHIQVDTNIPATLMGALKLYDYISKKLGIKHGETTPDGLFTLSKVECLASCGTCPVVQVNDVYYELMTPEKFDMLIDSLRKGVMPELPVEYNWATQCNVLLKRRGDKNAVTIEGYKKSGGYKVLDKALKMKPEEIISEVKNSQLRGRGGAGFPTGVKWSFLPKNTGKPVYLICNADEGEPGTFKDRQILAYDPHLLIEGMAISAYALGCKTAFIYIRGEFSWIATILEKAIDEAKKDNQLKDLDIIVHQGAGSYICGEETALIESIEGKRGLPRMKPPFPAVAGLYGCPTIVNNVETLASIPFIVENGADAFKKWGSEGGYGFKLYGVSGAVNKPGVYECPMGITFKELIEMAGGVKGKMIGVIVGGLSVPILTPEELKKGTGLKMDYESCIEYGTSLGSGGVMVISDEFNIPEIAARTIQFYNHESCGQCTPCRQGSGMMVNLLNKVVSGNGEEGDLDKVLWFCDNIKGNTLCPTGEAYSSPIKAMINKFRPEFEKLIN